MTYVGCFILLLLLLLLLLFIAACLLCYPLAFFSSQKVLYPLLSQGTQMSTTTTLTAYHLHNDARGRTRDDKKIRLQKIADAPKLTFDDILALASP